MLAPGKEILITSVEPLDAYLLHITFSDGHVVNVDFKPFLQASKHPETRKYLDTALFGSYHIRWGNLVWGDYDLCFPLESLYEDALQESPLQAVAESRAA